MPEDKREELIKEVSKTLMVQFVVEKGVTPELIVDFLLAREAEQEKKISELETVLNCWHDIFGTTQLSHASARLDFAEEKCNRIDRRVAEAVKALKTYKESYIEFDNRLGCHKSIDEAIKILEGK